MSDTAQLPATQEPQVVAARDPEAWSMTPAEFKAGLEAEKEKRHLLMEYVRSELVPGVDFMLIHRKVGERGNKQYCANSRNAVLRDRDGNLIACSACGAKYTLTKAGSEKLTSLMKVVPTFTIDTETMDALGLKGKGVAYRCHLVSLTTGAILADGGGCAMLDEKYPDPNKTLKMAQKSAQTDAALRLCGLSALMTQDIDSLSPEARRAYEEGEQQTGAGAGASGSATPSAPEPLAPSAPSFSPTCKICGKPMLLKTVKKEGQNKGRKFWGCPQNPGCRSETFSDTFIWESDWHPQAAPAAATAPGFPEGFSPDGRMPGGEYPGVRLRHVPDDYLNRMFVKSMGNKWGRAADAELTRRKQCGQIPIAEPKTLDDRKRFIAELVAGYEQAEGGAAPEPPPPDEPPDPNELPEDDIPFGFLPPMLIPWLLTFGAACGRLLVS